MYRHHDGHISQTVCLSASIVSYCQLLCNRYVVDVCCYPLSLTIVVDYRYSCLLMRPISTASSYGNQFQLKYLKSILELE